MKNLTNRNYRLGHIKVFVSILIVLASICNAQNKQNKIDSIMNLFNENAGFNGVVLVAEDGNITYKRGFGYANMEWKIPNTTDTKFKLASLGKQFTALLILQLVEEGKIKLDGKIGDYIPEYPEKTGKQISIHQLLTHSSGIPNYHIVPDFDKTIGVQFTSEVDYIALFKDKELLFSPGEKFSYSNFGYYLLGYIAERVTGKTYSVLVKEKIFIPAGMTSSTTEYEVPVIDKMAYGYKNSYFEFEPAKFRNPSSCGAAGIIVSTVEDFFKYDQALRMNKLISANYLKLINTPYKDGYGYGWNIIKYGINSKDSVTLAYHDGGTHGFVTLAFRFIENNKLIVVYSNVSPFDVYSVTRSISRILYQKEQIYPKTSFARQFAVTLSKSGVDAATKEFYELRKNNPDKFSLDGSELNHLGYNYLEKGMIKEALAVFKVNVEAFPDVADTYDSLAEAYMKNGEKELAIKNYKRSIELDPNNSNAKVMLKKLEN